ncbi:Telomere length regulation protein [Heterostelium album PN500]|uniref:Telomere length regulation protein n=1 Tax=Heterostelium pallidum (strain ATCC 26659 / Pp 5 / PN500) TaxID=670386 RepID=D3B7I6_HETP5|nr:Telomere length regulation protein [Heterostelium album PN500]EFA82729.1 Telomere length regulation protein [Heterostelium album PN500]|eukprot:XP_020434846.1 Telomere length regulation protein [Heterostelium album PN500]
MKRKNRLLMLMSKLLSLFAKKIIYMNLNKTVGALLRFVMTDNNTIDEVEDHDDDHQLIDKSNNNNNNNINIFQIIDTLKRSNDIGVVIARIDQLSSLIRDSSNNNNNNNNIKNYSSILDVLINDVYPNWYQALPDKQRTQFQLLFLPFNSPNLYLDAYIFITYYLDSNINNDNNNSNNNDQQLLFIINLLSNKLNYNHLFESIIIISNNNNSNSNNNNNNKSQIDQVVISIATLPDRIRNILFRLKKNSNNSSSSKSNNNNDLYDSFESIYLVTYIDELPLIVKQRSLSAGNVESNLVDFLSAFLSKVIKIGYHGMEYQIVGIFIQSLFNNQKYIDVKIKLISNTLLSIYGSGLDRLLDTLVIYLPKYVQNYLLHLLSSIDNSILKICLNNILKSWSDSYYIRHCTVEHHSSLTRSLIYFLKNTSVEQLEEYQVKPLFLKGIDVHLKSTIQNVNIEGMLLAEVFSSFIKSETPLLFDHLTSQERSSLNLDFNLNDDNNNNSTTETTTETTEATTIINKNSNKNKKQQEEEDRKKKIQMKLEKEFSKYDDPDMIVEDNDDDDDEDGDIDSITRVTEIDESSDGKQILDSDDDLKPYNLEDDESDLKAVKKKLYLRDCMMEFQTNKHTAESWESALISIASIVWSNPDDLDELSESVTKSLLHLTNEYGVDNFEVVRHEALVALAVNSTKIVVKYLTDCFYQNTFSLGQRLEILSVLTDAAQELSGYKEEKAKQMQDQQKQIHEKLAKNNPFILQQQNKQQQQQQSNIPTQFIGITRRWGVPTRPKLQAKTNVFHQLSPMFFYPFLSKYDKVTQSYSIDLKGFDIFLLCRLIHALAVFVECSGNSLHTKDMAKELYKFIWPLRYHTDISVRRAIIFSFSRIFYTISNDIIKIDYQDEIEELSSWLIDIANNDADKDCRVMSMGVLSKIYESFHK